MMTKTRIGLWVVASAVLLAGLSVRPVHAQEQFYNNVFCFGSTSTTYFTSNLFTGENKTLKRRFERAIEALGHRAPSYIDCSAEVSDASYQQYRRNITLHVKTPIVVVDVPPDSSTRGSTKPAAPAKAEPSPAAIPPNPAQEKALRTAQDQMDKSVSVAVADALRTVPNASDCRMVESPPKVTTGYGPTREDALTQAMARTNSCKVLTTHCLENTKTEFTKQGRPKVAGKFWDCRLSYSCGETQKVCTNKPAAASKQ